MFDYTSFPRAGIFRRIAALVYDALMSLAIFMLAGYIAIGVFMLLEYFSIISLVKTDLGIDWQQSHIGYRIALIGFCIFSVAYFFVYFWKRNGQTLGMRAWRLRVQYYDGSLISLTTGWARLATGFLGLGNLWVLFNFKNKQSIQDIATKTEVVVLSLEANKGKGWTN